MNRPSTPPPANTIAILAADLLATRAGQLLECLAFGSWEPAVKLREALATYSEVRIGTAMAEGAAEILAVCNDKAPETQRSVHS